MMYPLRAVTIVIILAAGVARSSAQPSSGVPSSQTALAEADRLNKLVEKLYGEAKFAEAVVSAERALALREKALGPSHPDVAQSLNNLALLHRAQGVYEKAEPLFVRALVIREKALGPSHPDVAQSLNNLAELYYRQGVHQKAEPLSVRALDIREKALGPMHPDVAQSLNNLALLYQAQGAYAKAESLLTRALAIHEKALGPSHPDVAASLNNLAGFYWTQGAYAKAEPLFARAADIQEQQLRTELVRLSEPRKRALMTLLQRETETIVSLHADAMPSSTSALELALTTVLRRKGRIFDSMVDNDTRNRSHLTPQLRDLLDQLAQARSTLAAQLSAPAGSPVHATVTATRTRIDELESSLSAASVEFRTQVEPVTLAKIQAALPAGTALVELVRYRRYDPRQPQQRWQEARYVAYLLTSRDAPQWVALGPAAPIDAQIDTALSAIHSKAPSEITRAKLQRLDALVLAPIRAQLSGVSHLILAPDGKLNLVPFEALIDPQGRYALERYLISYLSSGRDLLRLAAHRASRSPAVIVAGPDYGPLPSHPAPGTVAFLPLPGARAEAADLGRYFSTPPVTDKQATKEALAALVGPTILHVATHGFYARDPGTTTAPGSRGPSAPRSTASAPDASRGMHVAINGDMSSLSPPPPASDPAESLDRSGLALAGANQGAGGIVTAREIASLDWWGTQLVVLSACEMGIGAVASGDGVYGLRRVLILAGAASQVVSLWNVSDTATRTLMRDYYDELARSTGRAEAMRQAKLHLLHQPRYAHPYYWAAFIPAGDWRPLDKTVFSPRQPPPSSQAALEEADQRNKLVVKLYGEGKFAEAMVPAERALALREKALGPSHPDVATSLYNLAEVYRAQGAYVKAEPLYTRAIAIREKALGPSHPDVVTSLNNLAEFYRAQGAYAKAEPLYLHALDITEKTLGATHPDVATSLNNLAVLYTEQRAYRRAEPLLVRALNIDENALGSSHPDVAVTLNNLATLYRAQSTYDKAEPLLVRAHDIYEKALGSTHPDVATSLNNLAMLYVEQGTYGKAEPLLARALDIREKALGLSHPAVARSLNDLGALYRDQGAYQKAEPLLVRARDICEKTLGPNHPDTVTSLNNLAKLYWAHGDYDKAEPILAHVLAIRETALGPSHPEVAKSVINLAEIYEERGEYSKAERLFVRAVGIYEKTLGPSHPEVATGLNGLAKLYRDQGAYNRAESFAVRALDIRKKALGSAHPEVANTLNNLATLYWAQREYQKAQLLLARAAEIQEQQLRSDLARLSEPRRRALMTLLKGDTDIVVSFQAHATPGNTSALELALTTIVRRKGRLIDSLVEAQSKLRSHLTPRVQGLFDQLTEARSDLVAQLYTPAGPLSVTDRDAIAAIRAHIGDLESALSAASDDLRPEVEPATLEDIRGTLPADTALVEFVRYRRFDARARHPWQEERYLAYLLTKQGPPQWVALDEAASIDAEIDGALASIRGKVSAETTKVVLQRLDSRIFAPIRARLPKVSHLILAPDGKLNLVPFEALVDSKGQYAFENYLVSYVTAGRDSLRFAALPQPRSSAMIVAAPDYGALPSPRAPVTASFVPLAGAAGEAMDLRGYFPTAPVTGRKATKATLVELIGPAILHIATHGFFARFVSANATGSARVANCETLRSMFLDCGAPGPPRYTVDPAEGLDRAGLAMAGANLSSAGIVTAREIAGFDWWGTQLVVLSACETGVGAASSGDGVYGMRRALLLAGTASQVVSLWSVSDTATRTLMRDYYGHLARGIGRAEALRQAKRQLMSQPGYAHPYYWAAFIPAGDWRPLDKTVFSPRRP